MYDIAGDGVREVPIREGAESPEVVAGRKKLEGVIKAMMEGPVSAEACVEVDAFGKPITGEKVNLF